MRTLAELHPWATWLALAGLLWTFLGHGGPMRLQLSWRQMAWRPLLGLAAIMSMGYLSCARRHRLFFDEDAYANMALNVWRGQGSVITVIKTASRFRTAPYKWPAGFPSLCAPVVGWLGPRRERYSLTRRADCVSSR